MTESPNTQTPPGGDPPFAPPEDPPADPSKAAKKAPAKKAAAKKAAAPKAAAKPEPRSLYLPALPDGFEYATITIVGPNDTTIGVEGGKDGGEARVSIKATDLEQDKSFASTKDAVVAAGKAAKGLAKIAEQEAALIKVRQEALGL